jgi:hypothetical protein
MTDAASGSCVCGEVRWRIRPPYRFFQYCHCSRCRKRSGSAHAANIALAHDQLEWIAGEASIQRFELPSAKSWSNAFCRTCGSGVPWLTRNGRFYIAPAGGLDDDPGARPTRNVHFASRTVWYVHAAELEAHEGEAS